MSSIKEIISPFLTTESVLVEVNSTLSLMFIIYGFYILLFGISVNILCRRHNERPQRKLYLGWTVTLFTLATIMNAFEIWSVIQQQHIEFEAARTKEYDELLQYLTGTTLKTVNSMFVYIGTQVMNIVADTMLIHRCWTIWGSRKRVAFPLIFLSLVTNILGIVSDIMLSIGMSDTTVNSNMVLYHTGGILSFSYAIVNIIVNSIITLTTAGGIWLMSREARKELGQTINQKYKTIVAIILESGVLYPLTIIIQLVIVNTCDSDSSGVIPVDLVPVVWQVAGIAPTLIIVRAATGKTIDSVPTLCFASGHQDAQRSQLYSVNPEDPEFAGADDSGSGLPPSRQTASAVEGEKVV